MIISIFALPRFSLEISRPAALVSCCRLSLSSPLYPTGRYVPTYVRIWDGNRGDFLGPTSACLFSERVSGV